MAGDSDPSVLGNSIFSSFELASEGRGNSDRVRENDPLSTRTSVGVVAVANYTGMEMTG